ncbi:phosphotransferase [Rathayibacter sp. YIM 133350]|uniref:maltokinase N-terminal cap-like domain-containing protein n=1 Tax=Rathayibacter sp. YIM 133350 TaxID=3131992 RepID=UPI00307D69E8
MDRTLECITDWITRQRWYAAKDRSPQLRVIGQCALPGASDEVSCHVLLLLDDASRPAVLYQVPLAVRSALLPGAGHRLIGRLESGSYLYDGPHDPAFADALLAVMLDQSTATEGDVALFGERSSRAGFRDASAMTSRVLEGEQSNTSIIYTPTDAGSPVIAKVFRQLHHGENPDVTLQTALAEAGSPYVPGSVGSVMGEWNDVGRSSGRARGHLAFAQEFFTGVEDAWRVALRAAAAGENFTEQARALGRATAEVHRLLARLFPTTDATPGDVAAVVLGWHERLATAVAEIPQLAEQRQSIEEIYDAAQQAVWPPLQRVHGDYHLGQVLSVPDRGWVLLDFEGEPLRTMTDRVRPDVVLRDLAGMLRSFDYVAGSVGMNDPHADSGALSTWANDARRAFLGGYAEASELDLRAYLALRDAFELDKAVYEALYEHRNRQSWLPIPILGIVRVLERELPNTPGAADLLAELDETRQA